MTTRQHRREPRPAMTVNLPATFEEAERLTFARDLARRLQAPGEFGFWFGAKKSHEFLQWILQVLLKTADGRMGLVEMAKLGDKVAQAVLDKVLIECQSRDEKPPTELRYYRMLQIRHLIPTKASWGDPASRTR